MTLRAIIALASAALITMVFALVSGAGTSVCTAGDPDGDGVCNDTQDNCTAVANPTQQDNDEDGYGNHCDLDVNNDCNIGIPDVAAVFGKLLAVAPWSPNSDGAYDVGPVDGAVGIPDVAAVFGGLLGAPGPTSRTCASCNPSVGGCPGTP